LVRVDDAGAAGLLLWERGVSSRVIEGMIYEKVAVGVLCADTHPDHDTISLRENFDNHCRDSFKKRSRKPLTHEKLVLKRWHVMC